MSPIIGAVTGGFDFSNYFLPLSSKVTADSLIEAKKQGRGPDVGEFPHHAHQLHHHPLGFVPRGQADESEQSEAPKTPALTKQEMLLTEIRDLLKREQR